MSVVLRCVKCSGVLEERHRPEGRGLANWCPNCQEFIEEKSDATPADRSKPDPTWEDRVETLLTEIRDELRELNS